MFEPTGPKLYTAKSFIHGLGIFSKTKLVEHEFIHISHVDPPSKLTKEEANALFDNGIVRTASGSYVNHQSNPNAILKRGVGYWFIQAVRDIEPHEEVTIDYRNTPCGVNYDLTKFK